MVIQGKSASNRLLIAYPFHQLDIIFIVRNIDYCQKIDKWLIDSYLKLF
jgi:hypothetical protein